MIKKKIDALVQIVNKADELPQEVEGAINDLLAAIKPTPWWKAPFFKNGQFSKTAMFATIANVLVLGFYILSFFRGATLSIGALTWTIAGFDTEAAVAILAILNGTYVGNNIAKRNLSE